MQNKNNDTEFIGAYVPQHQAEYIALMAYQHCLSKSAWIRHQLDQAKQDGPSLQSLVRSIAHTIAEQWGQMVRKNVGVEWTTKNDIETAQAEFFQDQYGQLTLKGIDKQTAERIIDKAKTIYQEMQT